MLLWTRCTYNSTIFKQPGGYLAPRAVLSLCVMWYVYFIAVCWVFVSFTTEVQIFVFSLIVHMSAWGLRPGNESPWTCAKIEKVTNSCRSYWNEHTVNTLMLWQPMKPANNSNECHLKTALAFYTKICMAALHRDCMPFKKGQISIALLSDENTAVVLFFLRSSKST